MLRRWRAIRRWSDDRIRRAQLLDELERVDELYDERFKAVGRPGTDAYQMLVAEMYSEIDPFRDEVAIIETRQRIRKAHRWGVPIPDRPYGDDRDQYWERSPYGEWVLTDEGHKHLRRETSVEIEIFAKPWLSWIAIIVSVFSLAIAALR